MTFLRKTIFIFSAIIFTSLLQSPDLLAQGKYYPVNVSLWYNSLSLNKTDKDSTNFNLNIVYSKLGTVRGVGIGLAYTELTRNLKGLNITGGLTRIKGMQNGVTLSGIGNINNGLIKGFQIGGIANLATNDLKGSQISGIVNYLIGDMTGAQVSLVLNIASQNVKGLQIGNSNVIGGNLTGAQIGTTFNAVNNKMNGLQFAPGNLSDEVNGAQVGIINIAGLNRVLQLGIINVSDYQKGVPVGVVNVATKNGSAEWIISTGNFQSIATGIKIRAAKFVSILEAGYNEYDSDDPSSWTLAARYGYDFEFAKYYKVTPDIGYVEIFDDNADNKHEFAIQARVLGQVALQKKIRFFAGIGYSQRYEILSGGGNINTGKFIYLAGFSFF